VGSSSPDVAARGGAGRPKGLIGGRPQERRRELVDQPRRIRASVGCSLLPRQGRTATRGHWHQGGARRHTMQRGSGMERAADGRWQPVTRFPNWFQSFKLENTETNLLVAQSSPNLAGC
jgi:hypothetical protein